MSPRERLSHQPALDIAAAGMIDDKTAHGRFGSGGKPQIEWSAVLPTSSSFFTLPSLLEYPRPVLIASNIACIIAYNGL